MMLLPLTKRGFVFYLGVLQCLSFEGFSLLLATERLPCSIRQADILRGVGVAVLALAISGWFRLTGSGTNLPEVINCM